MARRRTNPAAEETDASAIWRWSIRLALLALWLFVGASLLSHNAADPPGHAVVPVNDPVANWNGPVGAFLAHWTFQLLGGAGAWILLLGSGVWIGLALVGRAVGHTALRMVGLTLVALAASGFQALLAPNSGAAPQGAGGLIAIAGVAELTERFSTLGSALWLLLLMAVGAVVAFDQWLVIIPAAVWRSASPRLRAWASALRERTGAVIEARAQRRRVRATDLDDDNRLKRVSKPDTASRVAAASDDDDADDDESEYEDEYEYEDDEDETEEESLPGAPQVFDAESVREKIAGLPVRFANASRAGATEEHLRDIQNTMDLEDYRFPGLDLLEDPEESYSQELEKFVRQQAEALEGALQVYRIDGEVVGIDSGPVITMYEVRLAPGTKVSRLTAVSSDIARALKAINIRIVPNMAGRDTVGIEVPNTKKEKVRLKELMTCADGAERVAEMKLPMFLGKDASGEPMIEDLASMPHILIAGTTGSGKSVCLNTIIMSFLFTKKPNELKMVLIDPKMVELASFRDIPHLMCPVVTEMAKAAAILEWAVTKMDERYELLAEAGVRDIAGYNALEEDDLLDRFQPKTEKEAASIPRKLPYIVFIIDELADLMMTNKEVEGSIVRIAQKARAVGIHLVLATQRPQANVVTGLIKSNMPGRMSFKVASGMDSRIVLDQKGGELLLGQGDMLFLSPRSHKLMRAQGTLVDDRETRRVVRFLRDVASPSFERQLVQLRSGEQTGEEHEARGLQAAIEDPLFERAVDIVLETKRGSVSLLQRRLAIGYTRASRLIDLMGEVGVIGAYKGTVAREVVISPEQWEQMRQELRAASSGQQKDLFEEPEADAPPRRTESVREVPVLSPTDDEDDDPDDGGGEAVDEADEHADAATADDAEAEDDEEYEYEYEYVDEGEDEEWDDEDDDDAWDEDDEDAWEDEDDASDDESEEEDDEEADDDHPRADTPDVTTAPFNANRPAPKG